MIRLLTGSDTKPYRDLRLLSLSTDPDSFNSNLDFESRFGVDYFATKIYANTKPPIFGIYGYFQDKTLLANAQLTQEYLPKQAHLANIFELYVHPDHRGQGLAKKLLTHIIDRAHTFPELEQLHLRVNSNNLKAKSLYESLGFKHIASRREVVKQADSYQDEHQYALYLQP